MAKLIVNCAVASLLVFNIVAASSLQSRVDLEQENAVESNYQDNFAPDQIREKRKINQIQQAKDGIKSAVIGLVFGKINSFIDAKTKLITQLDQTNIYKNKELGIEAPKDFGLTGITSALSSVIGPKLQFIGPKISFITQKIGSLSSLASGASQGGGDAQASIGASAGGYPGADFSAGGSVNIGGGYGAPAVAGGIGAKLFGGQQSFN